MDAIAQLSMVAVDWPLEDIWGTAVGFIAFMVVAVGLIGMASKSLAIPIMGGYLTFAFYAVETQIEPLWTTMFVTQSLVIIGMAFKLWRLEGVGDI